MSELTLKEKQERLLAARPLGGPMASRLDDPIETEAGRRFRESKSRLDDPIETEAGRRSREANTVPQQKSTTVVVPKSGKKLPPNEAVAEVVIPEEEGFIHQWKTTRATGTSVDVRGGTFTSQSGFAQADIEAVEDLGVTGSGYVILTVTREQSSRDVTATTITFMEGDPPESDYYEQHIPLAKITFADDAIVEIEQRRFEEINILEDLAVVNGEFMLADLLIASRNIYELPPS